MRILITGVSGFVGSHLAEYLLASQPQCEVHGMVRWRSRRDNIRHLEGNIELLQGDLKDPASLVQVLEESRPDRIFHLAAQSYVPASYRMAADTIDTNATGTIHLLEAVRAAKLEPRIHICSTSEVYGRVGEDESPITEDCPLRPLSPYAVGKCAADLAGLTYHRAYGMKTYRSRAFNHSGPRRGEVFVDSFFALQVARIEMGLQPPQLRVGDLSPVRTFCDVRDIVRAYWLLLEKGEPGEVYNFGGDATLRIGEILERLMALSPAGDSIEVVVDESLLRPTDIPLQVPCSDRFRAATGWAPQVDYDQTLRDMLDYWRSYLASSVKQAENTST